MSRIAERKVVVGFDTEEWTRLCVVAFAAACGRCVCWCSCCWQPSCLAPGPLPVFRVLSSGHEAAVAEYV